MAGQLVVISGGARGIGAQMADWMAAAGADVAICARTAAGATELANQLSSRHGVQAVGSECDVSDPEQVAGWVGGLHERFGRIDVVIANAAVFGPVGDIETVDMGEWLHTLAVDIGGLANLAHAAVPVMRKQGRGRLLTMSGAGIGGPRPIVRASAYVASKAAVGVLVEALALELQGSGVTVNALAPGAVPTGFMSAALDAGADRAGDALFEAAADQTPADLAGLRSLLSFIVSDDGGWVTGRVLSAKWDSPDALRRHREQIEGGSRLRLRRIDEDLYGELQTVRP